VTREVRRVHPGCCRAATKNNPVLIGEPGVGKTRHRRGFFAQRIIRGGRARGAERTRGIFALDMGAGWSAGAEVPRRVRGAAEKRS